MEQNKTEQYLGEIREALKQKKAIIGTDLTIKNLKKGLVKKIFITTNTPDYVKEELDYYVKLSNVLVLTLDVPNSELGSLCKKPFFISVISIIE